MSASCKACGAAIIWARTESGATMPLEREPVPEGMYRITVSTRIAAQPDTRAEFVPRERRHDNAPLFIAHWARCPKAKEFRK